MDGMSTNAPRGLGLGGGRVDAQAEEALAQEVDYRVRDVIGAAVKFATHAKRGRLCAEDVDRALKLNGVEQTYGFQNREALNLFRDSGFPGVSFIEDKVVKLDDEIAGAKFPLVVPLERGIHLHWLAVEGEEPLIPENVPMKKARTVQDQGLLGLNEKEGLDRCLEEDASTSSQRSSFSSYRAAMQQPLKHVLPQELQSYFDRVVRTVEKRDEKALEPTLSSLRTDPGLHPLLPYFASFIVKQAADKRTFSSMAASRCLLSTIQALVDNESVDWERYLHQVLPVIVTFLVRRNIGGGLGEDHWGLRRQAARVAAAICGRFKGDRSFYSLQTRIARTLVTQGLMDTSKALTSHYGAIVGISALGPHAVESSLVPHMSTYLPRLGKAMSVRNKNVLQQYEAYQCLDAVLVAFGNLVHQSEYNVILKQRIAAPPCPSLRGGTQGFEPFTEQRPEMVSDGRPAGSSQQKKSGKKGMRAAQRLLSVEQLRESKGGQAVLQAFHSGEEDEVEEVVGEEPMSEDAGMMDASVGLVGYQVGDFNDFTDIPSFSHANVVMHGLAMLGPRMLPFLHSEYAQMSL